MRRRKGEQEGAPGDPPVADDPRASEEKEEESPSVEEKTKAKKLKRASKCSLVRTIAWVVGLVALVPVMVVVVMNVVVFLDEFFDWKGYEKAQDINLPPHVMDLFHVFDSNRDGVLDPFEFAIIAEQLRTTAKVGQRVLERLGQAKRTNWPYPNTLSAYIWPFPCLIRIACYHAQPYMH